MKFYIPTGVGEIGEKFRLKTEIEERFTYKFFREFAVKTRLILGANYNISKDYSGEPYVRGYAAKELTGVFALLGNLELLVPVMNIDIKEAVNIPLKKDAKFLLYLALFADGGFTIDNYGYPLENFTFDDYREQAQSTFNANLGYNYKLIPALSAGAGIRFYPYFLNFIIRFDFSMNIIKAAIYNKYSYDIALSFTEMF
jgi:hypothetical protein